MIYLIINATAPFIRKVIESHKNADGKLLVNNSVCIVFRYIVDYLDCIYWSLR